MRIMFLAIIILSPIVLRAQWTPMGGPEGGDIVAIANAGSYLVCSAADGDIFTSTDGGTTWTPSGKFPGTLLNRLATSSGVLYATGYSGVYRSSNNGATWTQHVSAPSYCVVASGTEAIAGTFDGVFRSTNSGVTWTNITGNLPRIAVTAVIHGSNIFVGTPDSAVYRTTTSGASWTRAWTEPLPASVRALKSDGTNLYAAYVRLNAGRVAISTDNGTSWTSSPITGSPRDIMDLLVTPNALYVPSVYQPSSTAPWIGGVYVSTNGGSSWTLRNDGLIPRWTKAIAASGTNILVGTWGGGVFRSTNTGSTWSRSSSGLVKSHITYLTFTSAANLYAGLQGGGFFASTDSGVTWTSRNSGFEEAYSIPTITQFLIKGTSWFAGTEDDGLYKSTNNGAQWFRSGLPPFVCTGLAVRGTTELFATQAVTDGVYQSTDDGATWTQIMGGFTAFSLRSVVIGGTGTIFVGTFGGQVLRSTNNGTNWLGASLGGGGAAGSVNYIRFIGNTMFAATQDGPYRSTNFGVTWIASNTGLEGVEVNFIAIQDTNTLFASTNDSGMYVSRNNGATWLAANQGLPTLQLRGIRSAGPYLYCGTVNYGVWRRPVAEVLTRVDESNTGEMPTEFALSQNYPNPFNPSTRIAFSIQVSGFVSLKVYDLLGREVQSLVNEEMKVGNYEATFDARGLASGVYLYRLQAGSATQMKKLMLLR